MTWSKENTHATPGTYVYYWNGDPAAYDDYPLCVGPIVEAENDRR